MIRESLEREVLLLFNWSHDTKTILVEAYNRIDGNSKLKQALVGIAKERTTPKNL